MDDFILSFGVLCLLVAGLCQFLLHRNERILRALLAFLDLPDWQEHYFKLPPQDAMIFNPKYWLLWSYEDWRAWADRHSQTEVTQ